MCRAAVLEDVRVAKLRFNAGHLAVLLYEHVDHAALDPGTPVGREERTKPRPADLQPSVQNARLFPAQMMLARVRSFQPMDEYPLRALVVIAELQDAEFGRAQAGMIHQAEECAIPRVIDYAEEPLDLLGLEIDGLPLFAALALRSFVLRRRDGDGRNGFVDGHVGARYWRV